MANNSQHSTPTKNMMAKIGGVVGMVLGPLSVLHGLATLQSNTPVGIGRIVSGTIATVFGKAYFDAGRDATILAQTQNQSAGPNMPPISQQMAAYQQPASQPEMTYRNDFAARETARSENQAVQSAGRGAS